MLFIMFLQGSRNKSRGNGSAEAGETSPAATSSESGKSDVSTSDIKSPPEPPREPTPQSQPPILLPQPLQ